MPAGSDSIDPAATQNEQTTEISTEAKISFSKRLQILQGPPRAKIFEFQIQRP